MKITAGVVDVTGRLFADFAEDITSEHPDQGLVILPFRIMEILGKSRFSYGK